MGERQSFQHPEEERRGEARWGTKYWHPDSPVCLSVAGHSPPIRSEAVVKSLHGSLKAERSEET
jgi:hypothetical protein